MKSEIIDAIHLMYEDHPEIETDCYLYLISLKQDELKNRRNSLAACAQEQLINMGRCILCGRRCVPNEVEGSTA